VQNALWSCKDRWLLQPLTTVVISAQEPVAAHVFESGNLSKGALQFLGRQIESVVLDLLAGIFQCLQQQTYFAEIAG